jgi:hypothetical protein
MIGFEIFGIDPMGRMGCAEEDHLRIDLRMKNLTVLQWVVRIVFSVQPMIYKDQKKEKGNEEKDPFLNEWFHPSPPL